MLSKKSVVLTTKQIVLQYRGALLSSPLFARIEEDALEEVLDCLEATHQHYAKGEVIFTAGECPRHICVILEGYVDTVQEDFWGNQVLLDRFGEGLVFFDSFVLAQAEALPFTAIAYRETAVLMIDYRHVLSLTDRTCVCHDRLIENLLSISARKNIFLLEKISHVTKRTTRGKLLSYLSWRARLAGSNRFAIPYNRQGLANYLAVDRSAMSAELSRMQREGILSYDKNIFELHGEAAGDR